MYRLKLHLHGAEITEVLLESGREYTFGRGSNCDVPLEGASGISRQHFRVFEENNQWVVQVDAKFGDILYAGQPVKRLELEPGAVFKLSGYDFSFLERAREEQQQAVTSHTLPAVINHQSQVPAKMAVGQDTSGRDDFEGNDEATRVMTHEPETPFLRMVEPGGREEIIKLDARRAIAGREEGCNILLNDRKASRRQFELTTTPQGYFIRDLGSSNGTLLNGVLLQHDELRPIRSGDAIQVGRVVLHFEVRDPNFEQKLMVVPPNVRSDFPVVVQNPYEIINYPVPTNQGGAVRVGGALATRGGMLSNVEGFSWNHPDETKRKKIRFWIIVAAILVPVLFMVATSGPSTPKKAATPANPDFVKLAPDKQQQVKEFYALAYNLYIQGKYATAGETLEKLHGILPNGYENSRGMAAKCDEIKRNEEELRQIEIEKRRQEENRRIVESTIRKCEKLSQTSQSLDALNECLRDAISLDPENSFIKEQQNRVQARIEHLRMQEQERESYAAAVRKGKALYNKALALDTAGEYLDAIDAYKRHADSRYPDPEGLRGMSQRQILSITKKVESRVDEGLKAAEAAWGVSNYREAINHVLNAKKLNPKGDRAAEMHAKYRRELDLKLREIYEESVIAEGLGQVDDAKARWKKIMETDHQSGEYYKKAREKLRKFGGV